MMLISHSGDKDFGENLALKPQRISGWQLSHFFENALAIVIADAADNLC